MRQIPVTSLHLFRTNILLCLGIVALALINSGYVDCDMRVRDMWAKYRPLAMDESWSLVSSGGSDPGVVMPTDSENTLPPIAELPGVSSGGSNLGVVMPTDSENTLPPIAELPGNGSNEPEEVPENAFKEPIPEEVPENAFKEPIPTDRKSFKIYPEQRIPQMNSYGKRIIDVKEWQGETVQNNYFKIPNVGSTKLTNLITRHEPTFVSNQVASPVTTSGLGEKTIASYKILVPIFVPAIKRKFTTTVKPPVRFVKEQITEMRPVKNMVPIVKEVIKAEEVPQTLITNYVTTNGNPVPPSVNSNLRPNERIVSSEVQNIN